MSSKATDGNRNVPCHSIWAACTVLTLNCQLVILLLTKRDQEILLCRNFQELSIHHSPKCWYPRFLRCHDNRIITRRCHQISVFWHNCSFFPSFLAKLAMHFSQLSLPQGENEFSCETIPSMAMSLTCKCIFMQIKLILVLKRELLHCIWNTLDVLALRWRWTSCKDTSGPCTASQEQELILEIASAIGMSFPGTYLICASYFCIVQHHPSDTGRCTWQMLSDYNLQRFMVIFYNNAQAIGVIVELLQT